MLLVRHRFFGDDNDVLCLMCVILIALAKHISSVDVKLIRFKRNGIIDITRFIEINTDPCSTLTRN